MQGFRASINLQLDLLNAELLHRYVLTPSHSEVLRGILEGISCKGAKSHLLIGPYGTGKSLLATIMCQLLSRPFDDAWQLQLLEQAERLDSQLAARMLEAEAAGVTYIPVVINGRTGSLRAIVNQAIYRSLQQAGIDITTPNEATSILHTVDRWKQAYPETFAAFQSHLELRGWSEEEWRRMIKGYHDIATRDFVSFYPTVTSGTTWTVEHDGDFVDNLERITAELAAMSKGLFIVYDEFGRFLQSLGGTDTLQNMQDLQDFAEFVDRSENAQLLVVGHKHIRQYAASSRESIRGEFEKVEKRFRFYSLETDTSTFLRLAQEAIAPVNNRMLERSDGLEKVETLQAHPLFAEFTSYQLEQGIIRTLYPLHPVTVQLLPQLSNIFGQNERTLYSFLTDNERYSLQDHLEQCQGYYYADQLFRFFHVDTTEDKDHPGIQLYRTIAPYLDGRQPLQRRLIELLTLWSVTRLTQKQPATSAFLAFALGATPADTEDALQQLTQAKIVRYNSIRDLWELFDGSSIDVHAVVAARMTKESLSVNECVELLNKHLPITYVMPYEYNDEKDMLRYADIRFTHLTELKSGYYPDFTADDRVWLVLYHNAEEFESAGSVMEELAAPYCMAFPTFTTESVRPSLLQYKIMEQLLNDPVFLAEDTRVKSELIYLLHETSQRIKAFVGRYFAFEELDWRSGQERRIIKDLRGLEGLVTERLRHTYRSTPIIRNEAFNRNRISGIQRRALIDVIDRVISEPEAESLGITGFGPGYLIYASVLKNNGYRFSGIDGISCNSILGALREELLNRMDDRPIGKLSELVAIMEKPPYGIRSAVIPLLFVALLRDRWDQLLFYSHDMLTTHLSGASVLELVELSEVYEYRYYRWTAEEQRQLQELGRYFELSAEACASFVHVASALLHWLRAMPKFAQISSRVSPAARSVRDHIRAAEIDPYRHMKELVAYGGETLAAVRAELETFMACNEAGLESEILELTESRTLEKLSEILEELRHTQGGTSSKLTALTDWSHGALKLDRLAEQLVGVSRTEWSDATQDLFVGQFRYEWQLLHASRETAAAAPIDHAEPIPLSKKSQTIYVNVKNMLKYAGKDIPPQEIRQLLLKLLQETQT